MYRKELKNYANKKVRVICEFVKISRNHFDKDYACFSNCKLVDYNIEVDHIWLPIKEKSKKLYTAKSGDKFIILGYVRAYNHVEVQKKEILGVSTYTKSYKIGSIIDIKEA